MQNVTVVCYYHIANQSISLESQKVLLWRVVVIPSENVSNSLHAAIVRGIWLTRANNVKSNKDKNSLVGCCFDGCDFICFSGKSDKVIKIQHSIKWRYNCWIVNSCASLFIHPSQTRIRTHYTTHAHAHAFINVLSSSSITVYVCLHLQNIHQLILYLSQYLTFNIVYVCIYFRTAFCISPVCVCALVAQQT